MRAVGIFLQQSQTETTRYAWDDTHTGGIS
nr:MAG TPA: hypothetical protein [Caudoviricetes sp.]DAR61405.1 MAG TPA: hypothetical protein [Caudoviricetes sp.]